MSNSSPGSSISMTAASTIDWVDINTPLPPANPIGNYGISVSTTSSIQVTKSGTDPFLGTGSTCTQAGQHTYLLADDSVTPTGPVTLVEEFESHFNPCTSAWNDTLAAQVVFQTGNPFGGFTNITYEALGGVANINNVVVSGSGTVVNPDGSSLSYTITATDFRATVTTVFPNGLPSAIGQNPITAGFRFDVSVGTTLQVGGIIGFGTGSSSDASILTSHYSAHF